MVRFAFVEFRVHTGEGLPAPKGGVGAHKVAVFIDPSVAFQSATQVQAVAEVAFGYVDHGSYVIGVTP